MAPLFFLKGLNSQNIIFAGEAKGATVFHMTDALTGRISPYLPSLFLKMELSPSYIYRTMS